MTAFLRTLFWTFLLTMGTLLIGMSHMAEAQGEVQGLASAVQTRHANGQFDGVVLVARQGKMLYGVGVGQANREQGIPNTLDTPYRICSITKQFTSLLVMQEVQQGKVRLEGNVTDYLPDFRADTGGRITIKNLLTHTSGLASVDDALPETDGVPGFYRRTEPQFADAEYVIKTYLQGDLKAAPGEKFNYNNSDYIVLQAILEKVTGQSYGRLLQERITKPLGMTHTGLITQDTYSPKQAIGYVHDGQKIAQEPYYHLANFGAAAAIYSTARDLLRWDNALDRDTLLAKPYREIMFTADKSLGYVGLGSWVYRGAFKGSPQKPLLVERQGEVGGFRTLNLRAPEEGVSIIILSNTDTADLSATYMQTGLAYDLLKSLYVKSLYAPKHEAGVDAAEAERVR